MFNNRVKYVQGFVNDLGIDVKVKKGNCSNIMKYNLYKNTIYINVKLFEDFCDKHYLTECDLLEILTCHEIGHYTDFCINKELPEMYQYLMINGEDDERKKFILEREKLAWKYGSDFVSDNLKEDYDALNNKNIDYYNKLFS